MRKKERTKKPKCSRAKKQWNESKKERKTEVNKKRHK
jgi:hypothetical protein